MKIKTNQLTGDALDWAVAKCESEEVRFIKGQLETLWTDNGYKPSTDWSQGGPIIEREKTAIKENGYGHWFAKVGAGKWMRGPTPLIAAMRCYVASRLGEEITVPEAFLETSN